MTAAVATFDAGPSAFGRRVSSSWLHVVSLVLGVKLAGCFANVIRTEARTGPKTGAGVERDAEDCHVRPRNVFDPRKQGGMTLPSARASARRKTPTAHAHPAIELRRSRRRDIPVTPPGLTSSSAE